MMVIVRRSLLGVLFLDGRVPWWTVKAGFASGGSAERVEPSPSGSPEVLSRDMLVMVTQAAQGGVCVPGRGGSIGHVLSESSSLLPISRSSSLSAALHWHSLLPASLLTPAAPTGATGQILQRGCPELTLFPNLRAFAGVSREPESGE